MASSVVERVNGFRSKLKTKKGKRSPNLVDRRGQPLVKHLPLWKFAVARRAERNRGGRPSPAPEPTRTPTKPQIKRESPPRRRLPTGPRR